MTSKPIINVGTSGFKRWPFSSFDSHPRLSEETGSYNWKLDDIYSVCQKEIKPNGKVKYIP